MVGLLSVSLVAAAAVMLVAAPPGGGHDPAISDWFESLKAPDTGIACCSISDCRPVSWRYVGGRVEVWIGKGAFGDEAPDAWLVVPDGAILPRIANPMGEAVACFYGGAVRCFVWGSGA